MGHTVESCTAFTDSANIPGSYTLKQSVVNGEACCDLLKQNSSTANWGTFSKGYCYLRDQPDVTTPPGPASPGATSYLHAIIPDPDACHLFPDQANIPGSYTLKQSVVNGKACCDLLKQNSSTANWGTFVKPYCYLRDQPDIKTPPAPAVSGATSYLHTKPGPSPGPAPAPSTALVSCTDTDGWLIKTSDVAGHVHVDDKAATSAKLKVCTAGKDCPYPDLCDADKNPMPDGYTMTKIPNTKTCTIKKNTASKKCNYFTADDPLCLASTTKIPKLVNGNVQHVEVKDLHDGDMIRTTRGDYPISHIMKTHTIGPHTYVKVEKGSLGENTPSQDLYLTHEHSFSLGYYKNSVLNRNIHDPDQDDMTYLHITADQLADKLPGITRVQKEFDAVFNLVFDEHVSLDIYGLEVMMHHPKGNPYTLPEEKYQDKSKINNKVQKPLFAHYGMLENVKPEHMEMKDFLRGCITANLDNKFRIEDVNHPTFAPQKTMISHDIREKLRVA